MLAGKLNKMRVELTKTNEPNSVPGANVNYYLPLGDQEVFLNPYIGKTLQLEFGGKIICSNCGKKTKKSFSQGYCFPCMRKLAQCDMCIMKPETCHYHLGTCREPEWGKSNCFVPHYVYISNTSGLKVGITRHTQIPIRWIDQGATQASIMFKVATRQQSGMVEMAFKDLVADKTNWRTMLKENQPNRDLISEAKQLKSKLSSSIEKIIQTYDKGLLDPKELGENDIIAKEQEVVSINYPVLEFPTKIKSHNFDKNPLVEGTLMGIKGQYLIFDTGVINIRKFTSYQVSLTE
ncbi:MAG: hypothetical protein ACJAS9_000670 [Polaribacter sp.]|jgi:hypothetical protein